MKRSILILALLAIAATGAFAQGFSLATGGGGLFDWSFNNGVKADSEYVGFRALSFGGFVFFDATYAELDVSFAYGMGTGVIDLTDEKRTEDLGNELQLGFTLLGKFPIGSGRFIFFPLLGADYNLVLSAKDKNGISDDHPGDGSQFGLLGGVGFDLHFTKALFLRTEALFHFRFASKEMKDSAPSGASTTFGMGPRVKIGVGYRFGGSSGSTSSSSSKSARYMLVNSDTLNVRSGPSADNSVVGVLQRNTRVQVLDGSGTWWKIKSGSIEGYVNSSYLKEE
jgi:hypothetical protein